MTKIDLAIKALSALPPHRQDEIADLVLELTNAVAGAGSALTEDQLAEVRLRQGDGFKAGDASRIDRLLARLA
jgi:hypothetical protein